jgi:hypothetical protein
MLLVPRSFRLARPGRFELPTLGSVDQCSIQLSYGRIPAKGRGVNAAHHTCAGAGVNGSMCFRRDGRAAKAFFHRRKTRANYEKSAYPHAHADPGTTPAWLGPRCELLQAHEIAAILKLARLLLNGRHCPRPLPLNSSPYLLLGATQDTPGHAQRRRRRSSGLLFSASAVTNAFLDLPSGTALGTAPRQRISFSYPSATPSFFASRLLDVAIARMVELVRGVSRG